MEIAVLVDIYDFPSDKLEEYIFIIDIYSIETGI